MDAPPRVALSALFDAEIRRHDAHFRDAAAIGRSEHVLDVGCGAGESTRAAARAAADGQVLGIDVSAPLVAHARQLAADEGLTNVDHIAGDAQHHHFPPGRFDVCISRFGSMFFADAVAAFGNLAGAVRPDGRVVLLVWHARERNEWATAVDGALVPGWSPVPGDDADPFSLGAPAVVERVLGAAGFVDVDLRDVHEPVYYGPDVETAHRFVMSLAEPRELLAALDPAERERATGRLLELLAAHHGADGVLFDSRAWVVTARRSPPVDRSVHWHSV